MNYLEALHKEVSKVIVGQKYMIDRIVIGLFTGGHILVEGVPGLAKTLTIRAIGDALNLDFGRVQFTPDLLPADIVGTVIYNQKTGDFTHKKGPVFTNILLSDEINRAPAKAQSALLESMAELQVTIADKTYKLPEPFLVLATQNPIEQEGTYSLPEAQTDRFMMKLNVSYPTKEEEKIIMERMSGFEIPKINPILDKKDLEKIQKEIFEIFVDDSVKNYILDIVFMSRNPVKKLKQYIEYGASPRASINMLKVAKAYAYLNGKDFVSPDDVKAIVADVLRHRIVPSFEAEAEDLSSDDIIKMILEEVPVP